MKIKATDSDEPCRISEVVGKREVDLCHLLSLCTRESEVIGHRIRFFCSFPRAVFFSKKGTWLGLLGSCLIWNQSQGVDDQESDRLAPSGESFLEKAVKNRGFLREPLDDTKENPVRRLPAIFLGSQKKTVQSSSCCCLVLFLLKEEQKTCINRKDVPQTNQWCPLKRFRFYEKNQRNI